MTAPHTAKPPPSPVLAVILKDVLGQSLEETAQTMGTTVGAVKAALSRGGANIARAGRSAVGQPAGGISGEKLAALQRYADLFNARNWDGLRALLGAESRLDVVSRIQQRMADAGYTTRYARYLETETIRAQAGFVDGVPAIAMFSPASSVTPAYFIVLETEGDRVALIRDYRYVPYIADDARFSPNEG